MTSIEAIELFNKSYKLVIYNLSKAKYLYPKFRKRYLNVVKKADSYL